MNENNQQYNYSDEELHKIRAEVLAWIEKNERKVLGKSAIKERNTNHFDNTRDTKKNLHIIQKLEFHFLAFIKYFILLFSGKKSKRKLTADNENSNIIQKTETDAAREKPLLHHKKSAIYIILFAVVSIVFIGDIVLLYFLKTDNSIVVAFNKYLPFPALKINTSYVSYASYVTGIQMMKKISPFETESSLWYYYRDLPENNFIRHESLKWIQKKYSLNTTAEEIKNKTSEFIISHNIKNWNSFLQKYALHKSDIQKYIIIPNILSEKIILQYKKKDELWSVAQNIAKQLHLELESGNNNYEAVIAQNNKNEKIDIIEKDLGFITKEKDIGKFSDSLYTLKIHSLSDIQEDADGFHLYIVTDRLSELEMIKVMEIFIEPNINYKDIFLNEIKGITIKKYI